MSLAPPAPPGWNYYPSSWSQRLPIAGVALVGFGIAAYLTAFQIGVIERVWEPIFGSGSDTVLTGCLLAAPLAGGHPAAATAAAIASAAAVLGTARFTGTSSQSLGGGWKALGKPRVRR